MVMMTANRTPILVMVMLWFMCGTAVAAVAEDSIVIISGSLAERERTTVVAAIETATRGAGWSLPAKPFAKRDTDALLACSESKTPWTCLPSALRAIRRVFVVRVESSKTNGSLMLVLTGKAIATGQRTVVIRQRYCELCADDKLGAASTELANDILRELAVRSGNTRVGLKSNPTGAQIIFDGDRIGATEALLNTYPGRHLVIFEKPGFLVETREIEVEEGKTAELVVQLQAGTGERKSRPRPSRMRPALTMSAGAVLLVGGIALVFADDDVANAGPQPERYFDSAGIGIGCAITGAVVIGGGLYWWVRKTSARSAPVISITSAGGVVGWSGRF